MKNKKLLFGVAGGIAAITGVAVAAFGVKKYLESREEILITEEELFADEDVEYDVCDDEFDCEQSENCETKGQCEGCGCGGCGVSQDDEPTENIAEFGDIKDDLPQEILDEMEGIEEK